jgi:hypothetical protein
MKWPSWRAPAGLTYTSASPYWSMGSQEDMVTPGDVAIRVALGNLVRAERKKKH